MSVVQEKRVHQVAVAPDKTHVGIRFDIGHTARAVGFLEEVLERAWETPTRRYMSHTVNVYVGYTVAKIERNRTECSSSFAGKARCTPPPQTKKGNYRRSRE